ncbi:MAG: hypothetical protein U1E02_07635 [Hydrogenophaga sp.]|nr:hypothetical protein [Hydrogenophaga sp.]
MRVVARSGRLFFGILFLTSFYGVHCSEKQIVGAWKGGFGNIFLGALHHLAWCDEQGYVPVVYWDNAFLFYQPGGYNGSRNAWEYYFEPVSSESYVPGDYIHRRFTPDRYRFGLGSIFNRADREAGKKIIDKYVHIVPSIQKKIEDFYVASMQNKKTIGIHLRGTDKYVEVPALNPALIFKEANKQARLLGVKQFFIATDEYRLLELAKKELEGTVIYYDCRRSGDGHTLQYSGSWPQPKSWVHDASLGEEFLIEFMLISKCFLFIHTDSNAAMLPFFFNPDLLGVFFNSKGEATYF